MYSMCPIVVDLSDYALLSESRRRSLDEWITQQVDDRVLWSYTSLGIQGLFEKDECGFPLSHAQFKAALLMYGLNPRNPYDEVWIFETPNLATVR